jgi:hypothetical protein
MPPLQGWVGARGGLTLNNLRRPSSWHNMGLWPPAAILHTIQQGLHAGSSRACLLAAQVVTKNEDRREKSSSTYQFVLCCGA